MRHAIERVPALETAPVRLLMNGPESFTPDNYFILGEAPEARRYYVGAGFCSGGIAAAGGAGRAPPEGIGEDPPALGPLAGDNPPLPPFPANPPFPPGRPARAVGGAHFFPFPHPRAQS